MKSFPKDPVYRNPDFCRRVSIGYIGWNVARDLAYLHVTSVMAYFLLGLALFVALGFEFVNGFHDTANAVATVI